MRVQGERGVKIMAQWEHAITVHQAADILLAANQALPADEAPVLYCDSAGKCFFDEAPNPYITAIKDILNEQGKEGWILVQVVLRQRDMICFWRREVKGEAGV